MNQSAVKSTATTTDRDADLQQQQQWQSPQFEAKRNTFTLLKTNEAIEGSAQAQARAAQCSRGVE